MTKYGFFSIVQKGFEKEFQIRARERIDIDHAARITGAGPVIKTPKGDYSYRIEVTHEELQKLMRVLIEDLDYNNFKSMIALQQDQKEKLDAYHDVWGILEKHCRD